MPSGSRKRKGAKKKMKNGDTSGSNNSSTTHSQASEDRRSSDDRESENGEIEPSRYEEVGVKEVLQKNGPGAVDVVEEDRPIVILSSEDKEVAVVEEKPVKSEESKAVVVNSVLESFEIPKQDVESASAELVKDIFSLSKEINVGLGSSVTSDLVESGLIKKDDLALPISDEKEQFSAITQDLQSEKVESKTVSVEEGKSSADPNPSTGLDAVQTSEVGNAPVVTTILVDNVKDISSQKRSVDQTSNGINSLPIQRTSVLGCCGLFELFSGSNK